jgi:hypothetical protein
VEREAEICNAACPRQNAERESVRNEKCALLEQDLFPTGTSCFFYYFLFICFQAASVEWSEKRSGCCFSRSTAFFCHLIYTHAPLSRAPLLTIAVQEWCRFDTGASIFNTHRRQKLYAQF